MNMAAACWFCHILLGYFLKNNLFEIQTHHQLIPVLVSCDRDEMCHKVAHLFSPTAVLRNCHRSGLPPGSRRVVVEISRLLSQRGKQGMYKLPRSQSSQQCFMSNSTLLPLPFSEVFRMRGVSSKP